jgi:hypothetical protein
MSGNDKEPKFNPTFEEIEAACLEIQSRWSESERRSRLVGSVCLTKHKAEGVEASAREALDEKLAKKREKMRQAGA